MASKIMFYKIIMIGTIFTFMTSSLISSNGFFTAEGRPQTLVFKIGRFVISNSNSSITYELNLMGIHNPSGAKLVLGDVSENDKVVADLLLPAFSKTKDKQFGTLLMGTITDTSLKGPMKGKSVSDLITAMRKGDTYVSIDKSTDGKGEIKGLIKIDLASNGPMSFDNHTSMDRKAGEDSKDFNFTNQITDKSPAIQ